MASRSLSPLAVSRAACRAFPQHPTLSDTELHLASPPVHLISENASLWRVLKSAIRNAWDAFLIGQVSQQWPPSHCPFLGGLSATRLCVDIWKGWPNVAWHWHKLFIHKSPSQTSRHTEPLLSPATSQIGKGAKLKSRSTSYPLFPRGLLLVWRPGLEDSSRRPEEVLGGASSVGWDPLGAAGVGEPHRIQSLLKFISKPDP